MLNLLAYINSKKCKVKPNEAYDMKIGKSIKSCH